MLITKNRGRLAFEVQWSNQTWADTMLRQQRYEDSGVRGLWLLRHPTYEPSEETPAFQIRKSKKSGCFEVLITPPAEDRTWGSSDLRNKWLDLEVFVTTALNRGLKWAPAKRARRFDLWCGLYASATSCRCGTEVDIPYSFVASPIELPGHRPYWWHQGHGWLNPPAWLLAFTTVWNQQTTGPKLACAKGLDARSHRYFSWHCPQCQAEATAFGAQMVSRELKGVTVEQLPVPRPQSPEAKFCDRWWVDLAAPGS
ncbi:MAG TPA: hypothetical protein VJU59_11665 [Paraburkholderia sp.]|uniref:hypothetical protein n=1 Tax=Paraburkholderia sp. TaxID=1926495 RepID=UPI002B4A1811|nr:hypothetical protein [Paraburkholderia sp.]HKR40316.1 hypothetical protein [Paraburkholderia sp.]